MTLRWGLLATGNIARTFATALAGSQTGELRAVGSRTAARAATFAAELASADNEVQPLTYDELIAHPDLDVVYIATPHPQHAGVARRRRHRHGPAHSRQLRVQRAPAA